MHGMHLILVILSLSQAQASVLTTYGGLIRPWCGQWVYALARQNYGEPLRILRFHLIFLNNNFFLVCAQVAYYIMTINRFYIDSLNEGISCMYACDHVCSQSGLFKGIP